MKRADRFHILFKKLNESQGNSLINFWSIYFSTNDRIYIYKYISILLKEVDFLEKDLKNLKLENNTQAKLVLNTLRQILKFNNLNELVGKTFLLSKYSDINSFFEIVLSIYESNQLNNEIDISQVDLDNFKDMIEEEIKKLIESDINIDEKEFFLNLFEDFSDAILMYKISGLSAFDNAIKKNLCKLKFIIEDKELSKLKPFINVSKKIIGITFSWIIKYGKNKVNNILEHKMTKLIEDTVNEWKNTDKPSNDNLREDLIEEAEIE